MKIHPIVPCTSGSNAATMAPSYRSRRRRPPPTVRLKNASRGSDEGDMPKRTPADHDDDMWVWRPPAKEAPVEATPDPEEPAVEDGWYQVLSRLRRKDEDAD
jgi:hypothetical protein